MLNGVVDSTTAYGVSGTTLTSEAPASGDVIDGFNNNRHD